MANRDPVTELEPQFSSDGATPTLWKEGREHLERAEVYWLSTLRPDGRPHITPLIAIWLDGALYFLYGAGRTQGEEPRAEPALRRHDRAQRTRRGP